MPSLMEGVFLSLEIPYFYIVMIPDFKYNFSDICILLYRLPMVSLCCFVMRHHQPVFPSNVIVTIKRHSLKKNSHEGIFSASKQYLPL